MRFENYIETWSLNESNMFIDIAKSLFKKPANAVKNEIQKAWKNFANTLKDKNLEKDALKIINKHFKTHYKSLDQISTQKIAALPGGVSEDFIDEDFKHFWELVRAEGFPTLAFYPALTCWLEIDKLIKGAGDANWRTVAIYAMLWLILVSGKHIVGFLKWKKEKPEEFGKEGSRKNPFAV